MLFKKKQAEEVVEEVQEAVEAEEAAPKKKGSLVKTIVVATGTVAVAAGAVAFFTGTSRGRAITRQAAVAAAVYVPKAVSCVKAGVQAALAEAANVSTTVDTVVVSAPAVAQQLPVSCIVSKLR